MVSVVVVLVVVVVVVAAAAVNERHHLHSVRSCRGGTRAKDGLHVKHKH
jgi:hypothetical protein